MKSLIKTLSVILLSIGLVNCGGSDDGPGAPAPGVTDNGLTSGVSKIDYVYGITKVSYTSLKTTDFYITYANGGKKCLASSADDQNVSTEYAQLMALLSSATIGKGTRDTVGANPRYLTITYADKTRTFNLNEDSASTSEEILSNGADIAQYLDGLHSQINSSANGNCFIGK